MLTSEDRVDLLIEATLKKIAKDRKKQEIAGYAGVVVIAMVVLLCASVVLVKISNNDIVPLIAAIVFMLCSVGCACFSIWAYNR